MKFKLNFEKMTLKTPFGTAKINPQTGYYHIISTKEGNFNKLLHRLIYEAKYGEIPKNYIIHHVDEDLTNNDISNLKAISKSKHRKIHSKPSTLRTCMLLSKKNNASGYFRVTIMRNTSCLQGFTYVYRYYENNISKSISSVNLNKLRKKVKEKGLPWFKLS